MAGMVVRKMWATAKLPARIEFWRSADKRATTHRHTTTDVANHSNSPGILRDPGHVGLQVKTMLVHGPSQW